ncbi:restriction endonuclease subunit S [Alteromonas ponticola]|uniref:Restriction endonuclease subunit S n=1 Tax=Alteromonas ponticola TaxID=2720613 RepID=A0ABX1R5F8_9ALTE|nr:restriction endonuclease subunit S [Alteromonas ponticola]NMH60998.1 restriction endonuclease subunit S [Alteromonas ponticola]
MAGKYQSYTETKESGIPWVLDELPAHWEVLPAYSVLRHEQIKNVDGKETNVLSLSYGNIKIRNVENNSGLLPESFNTYQLVWPGDIILRLTDLQNDKRSLRVGRSSLSGIITSAYLKLKASNRIDDRYLYRLLHFYDTSKVFYGMGGGLRQSLKFEDFRRLPIVVPTLNEQRAIAIFLDHETAKIDALIAKQERLIELLKEKRQAVISHAVTKGLNPDVPMTDSGIEWLGEVPEHWKVSRLKFETEVVDCRNKTPVYFDDGEYFVVRTTNVKNQQLNFTGALFTDETNFKIWTQRGVPPAGSILFTREAPTGEVCIVPEELKFCMGQRMMNFIPRCSEYRDYLFDFLISDCLDRYINAVSHGSTVSHLRVEQVENIPVLVPPVKEIRQIHSLISRLKKKLDAIERNALDSIMLLKERKSSLISAAVTGKIDVRNWQSHQTEDAYA